MTETASLLAPLHGELIALLRGLSADDWLRPTVAGRWRVRDVAAHLLDGYLRRLAGARDGHPLTTRPVASYADVMALIADLNHTGVTYGERYSPRLLVDLLDVVGPWVCGYLASLPPDGEARFPVAWAGESRSAHWMDVGREYTEHWHHQAQIRDAVGAPLLLADRWYQPLLDISVRVFPHAYRNTVASIGTAVVFGVDAGAGLVWSVVRTGNEWDVRRGTTEGAAATVTTTRDGAWRLLYNALSKSGISHVVDVEGDRRLTAPMLDARSVMVP